MKSMNNKTGKVLATSAAAMVSMALTLGMAPASQAAPLAPAVTVSATTISTTIPSALTVKASAQSDPWEAETLSYINQYRAQRGLAPLTWNQQIANVSQGWAEHLGEATKSANFNWANIHRADAGGSLIPAGATWYREVVVFEFSPKKAVDWWMQSPGHRDAIMSPNATQIGIGSVTPTSGPYAGWNQMVANLASYPGVPITVNPAGTTNDTVIGTAKATYDVNFRAGAGTNTSILQTVPQGATVNLLGASVSGWTKVSYAGKTGYISTDYLATTATPAAAPAPAPAPVADTAIGTARAIYEVNFRAGAGTNTAILQAVPQGGTVNVLGASVNGWTKVSYAGKTGYISSPYLTATSAPSTPVPTPAPVDTVVGTATTAYGVNFRTGTSTNTGILMMIPQGAKVNLLGGDVNGWTKISYAGKTGYVSSPYLISNSGTMRTTYAVNFRAGASTGTGILMVVPQGATVNVVTGSVNGWTQVSYAGKTGYISTDYLTR